MPEARGRVVLVGAMAVGVGLSLAACGSAGTPLYMGPPWDGSVRDSDVDSGMDVAPWPPFDTATDQASPADSGSDPDGGVIIAYGPPPP